MLQQIHSAKTVLSSQQPEKKAEKTGLASWFDVSSLFEDSTKAYGDMSVSEVKKLVSHLEQTASNLCHLFSVSLLFFSLMAQTTCMVKWLELLTQMEGHRFEPYH